MNDSDDPRDARLLAQTMVADAITLLKAAANLREPGAREGTTRYVEPLHSAARTSAWHLIRALRRSEAHVYHEEMRRIEREAIER